MGDLLTEVGEFRRWAEEVNPAGTRMGEWECDYKNWPALCTAVVEFVASKPFAEWSGNETSAVLYAIARDNESEYLAQVIRERHVEILVPLARASVELGERDDRWQFAEQLGRLGRAGGPEEGILRVLVRDEHEYVRRKALRALARLASPCVESEALRAWECPDVDQEWARMMA